MTQVTMDGKEYVELINKAKQLEETRKLFINAFVLGHLEVGPEASYRKVDYTCKGELPKGEAWDVYREMREQDIAERLERNPLAVQLLYDEGDKYLNSGIGNFTSFGWDDNKPLSELSPVLDQMIQKLDAGERLVEETEDKEDEE